MTTHRILRALASAMALFIPAAARASEADIRVPALAPVSFSGLGGLSGLAVMIAGLVLCVIGAGFGLLQYQRTKALPVHRSMRAVSNIIWET